MFLTLVRYLRKDRPPARPPEPARILGQQNLRQGILVSLLMAGLAMALWVYVALVFDKYFPWVSMLQGILIGLAMRRGGRGVDWRFPLAAAVITAAAAAAGSFLVALFLTGREFGTGALELVNEISTHTVATFYTREFGIIGVIYMLFAACLAAFYANRRLSTAEAVALRRLRHGGANQR
ncbi:hypothetical protein [Woeseia oceani]|uniref:Uncharacterized protein n=1 Tax=Woeseia oceani TaxID=1548547 RepID=A0A193LBM8_9GAMM|nr:hypothetical protein [Woeseia oceani]ANO49873.1 hypothetical protein BA177_00375 [Woeseia oceani]